MNINEIRKEKQELEKRILNFVSNELKTFEQKTGVYIEDINIEMRVIGVTGSPVEIVTPISVTCEITI